VAAAAAAARGTFFFRAAGAHIMADIDIDCQRCKI